MYFLPNYVFSLFSFTGFMLCMIPLPWHLEAWNTGTCLFMVWTGIGCLNLFINSVVWNGNVYNPVPVWCDISTRIVIGLSVALPTATLCLIRRIYHILTIKKTLVSAAERHRAIMFDVTLGIGIPLLQLILAYIVQGHRFDIFENIGCFPATYNVPEAYILVFTTPVLIGVIALVYYILATRAYLKERARLDELLSAHRNLTYGRFLRLMCLTGIGIITTISISSWLISMDIKEGIEPWVSWANVKWGFHRVEQYPSIIWMSNKTAARMLEMNRWLVVACAFIFFGFFGFAEEARKNYCIVFYSVGQCCGYSKTFDDSAAVGSDGSPSKKNMTATISTGSTLPIYVQQLPKHLLTSLDDKMSFDGVDGKRCAKIKSIPPSRASSGSSTSAYSVPSLDGEKIPESPALARPETSVE